MRVADHMSTFSEPERHSWSIIQIEWQAAFCTGHEFPEIKLCLIRRESGHCYRRQMHESKSGPMLPELPSPSGNAQEQMNVKSESKVMVVFTRLPFIEVTCLSITPIGRVAITAFVYTYMSTVHAKISTRGWSLESLVQTSPNFCKVNRVSASVEDIFSVLRDYELRGVPLVIEDFHKHERWPSEMFTLENFAKNSESTGTSLSNSWKP